MPWQNFDRITTTPAPVIPSPSSSFDPFAPPPSFSLASIMSEQKAQVAAVEAHKAPRSFADVMAQEQAAARRKEEEDREAREFEKWFAEEAKRVQAEEAAIRAAVTGGSGSGKGKKGAKGAKAGPAGGAGPSGSAKGGKKSSAAPGSTDAVGSGTSTPASQKVKKAPRGGKAGGAAKGGGGGASENRNTVGNNAGLAKGKGKSSIGGAESVPFTPSLPV
jgi:hypothetical protein